MKCFITMVFVAALSASCLCEGTIYLGVLESQNMEPEAVTQMHSEIAALELQYIRPLKGRLEGQGSLWALPEEMTFEDASAAVSGIGNVTGTVDPLQCAEHGDCVPEPDFVLGKMTIRFESPASKVDASEALEAMGFSLSVENAWEHWGYVYDYWRYFPAEYSNREAWAIARAVPGVSEAFPIILYELHREGDVNGDGVANILDLIWVRNLLGQDVFSGDNWKADVNMDGKINILDLIHVRNCL